MPRLELALKALALEPGHKGTENSGPGMRRGPARSSYHDFILGEMYRDGTLEVREDFLVVGRMAMLHQNFQLAEEVFQALLDDAASEEPRLKGRLTKAMLKEAKQTILLAQLMAEGRIAVGWSLPGGRPRSRRS